MTAQRTYTVTVFDQVEILSEASRSQAVYRAFKAFREAHGCGAAWTLPHFTKVALKSCRLAADRIEE